MGVVNYVWQILRLATVMDVIDILVVATIFYRLIKLLKNTSAARILKGLLVLLIIIPISDLLGLHMINYLLTKVMSAGLIALCIIFQPELRKMLEQFGKSRVRLFNRGINVDKESMQMAILQTVEAASSLSWSKTGALIVFEKHDDIAGIVRTGTEIDSMVSAELLKNLFYNKAPLHDGAVVVSNARIQAAGCLLPLSTKLDVSKELGTRHRAAIGMSENYDSPCVVVSEETGAISFAVGGILKRHLSPETLEKLLTNELMPPEDDDKSQGLMAWLKGKFK